MIIKPGISQSKGERQVEERQVRRMEDRVEKLFHIKELLQTISLLHFKWEKCSLKLYLSTTNI